MTGGDLITYAYDFDGLVTLVKVGTGTPPSVGTIDLSCTASSPDPDCRSTQSGRVQMFTTGVVKTILGYDGTFGDLTSLATTCTGSTCTDAGNCGASGNCFIEDLTYDDLARISTRADTVRSGSATSVTYGYDFASRLETITGGVSATYAYDAGTNVNHNGNRTSAPSQTLAFDEQDRITTSGYSYDNDGRLTSKNNGTTTYSYDDFGQLTSAAFTGNIEIQFVYDGLGRRVTRKKFVSSTETTSEQRRYLYAQGNRLVAMYNNSGTILQQYVYATGRHVPDAVVAGGVLYRIVSDHLGSMRMVVKASDGAVVQATKYDAWGKTLSDTVSGGFERVPFGFAGALRDIDSDGTERTGFSQMGALVRSRHRKVDHEGSGAV